MSDYPPHRGPSSHALTRDENRRGGSSTSPAKLAAAAANGRASLGEFRKTSAGRAAVVKGGREGNQVLTPDIRRRAGLNSNGQRWQCDECGHVSTPRGIANHQRLLRVPHAGRTRIDNQETA